MIFNKIKFHVNTSLGLVGGLHPLPPLCPRLMLRPRRCLLLRIEISAYELTRTGLNIYTH